MNSIERGDLNSFWRTLQGARQRVLLLDYDGTLAPFREERDQAVPYPGVREELDALLADNTTRLVIISGRSIEDLIPLLGMQRPPEIWGCHGWERLQPGGERELGDLPAGALSALDAAQARACRGDHARRCERKPVSVAFHWRGLGQDAIAGLEREIRDAWAPLAEESGLELHPFDGGLELRVPGRDKGFAVRKICEGLGGDAAVAYLGDDLTDEDAFRALAGRGLRVLVRSRPRPTEADLRLDPPEELIRFLRRWRGICAQGRSQA